MSYQYDFECFMTINNKLIIVENMMIDKLMLRINA